MNPPEVCPYCGAHQMERHPDECAFTQAYFIEWLVQTVTNGAPTCTGCGRWLRWEEFLWSGPRGRTCVLCADRCDGCNRSFHGRAHLLERVAEPDRRVPFRYRRVTRCRRCARVARRLTPAMRVEIFGYDPGLREHVERRLAYWREQGVLDRTLTIR